MSHSLAAIQGGFSTIMSMKSNGRENKWLLFVCTPRCDWSGALTTQPHVESVEAGKDYKWKVSFFYFIINENRFWCSLSSGQFANAGEWLFLFSLFSHLKGVLLLVSFTLGMNKTILALIWQWAHKTNSHIAETGAEQTSTYQLQLTWCSTSCHPRLIGGRRLEHISAKQKQLITRRRR